MTDPAPPLPPLTEAGGGARPAPLTGASPSSDDPAPAAVGAGRDTAGRAPLGRGRLPG
jgi:hypothetical protein